jgi:hypothetical protein
MPSDVGGKEVEEVEEDANTRRIARVRMREQPQIPRQKSVSLGSRCLTASTMAGSSSAITAGPSQRFTTRWPAQADRQRPGRAQSRSRRLAGGCPLACRRCGNRGGIATPRVVIASIMVFFRRCGGGRAYTPAAASRRRLVRKSMRQGMIVLGGCLAPARIDGFDDDAVERRTPWKQQHFKKRRACNNPHFCAFAEKEPGKR